MSIGVQLLKCHYIVEYTAKECFSDFKKDIVQSRIDAVMFGNNKIMSATKKLIGNAGFGGLLINRAKFRQVSYEDKLSKVKLLVNDGRFVDASELGRGMFEVKMKKKTIDYNIPSVLDLPSST